MALSSLDANQVIRDVHDPVNEALKVNLVAGSVSVGTLDVLASYEIAAASIPDNATTPFEITASLPDDVGKILVYDTTGQSLQLRTGAATGTLKVITGPGQDTPFDCQIAAGTRVSIRSNQATPSAAGTVVVIFMG